MEKVKDVVQYLESLAPRSMQEEYDNSGLIVGDLTMEITGVLVCLDSLESTVDEAIANNCNVIVAHHPIVFKGLKSLTGKNYVERVVIKCIQHNIALYAIHTNFDNYYFGVNYEIGRRIGLKNLTILQPKANVLNKLSVFVPIENADDLSKALFSAGAGNIGNYQECSFSTIGLGTFKPIGEANPTTGKLNELSSLEELKLEFLVSSHLTSAVVAAMKANHPYEEVAYDLVALSNENQTEGSGMVGELAIEMDEMEFLKHIKSTFSAGAIRYTKLLNKNIKKVAFCGGSGSFLLSKAKQSGADVFITADFKYHEFFDADNQIMIVDIGHYESEQFTINLLADIITKKFANFAVRLTEQNTNPINYL
ncbi:MAG: Nif3-like dinuclear metal center hexameric protein [Bacteroidota bacterium]